MSSSGELIVANWVYSLHLSGASKKIYVTIKPPINAAEFSYTIQLSPFVCLSHTTRAHQTKRSGRNSRPISAEIALPRSDSKAQIKSPCFFLQVSPFLVNNLRFMVKLINVINVKIHKNERKWLYSSNNENLTCWDKIITANFYICTDEIPVEIQIPNLKNKQTDTSFTKCVVGLCYFFVIILTQL
jgi:hypothetical protein